MIDAAMLDAAMLDAAAADRIALLAPALAEVLLRFVWQGAAIALLAWAALRLLRDARPQARYAVACLALLSCLLVPAAGLLQAVSADAPSPAAPAFELPLSAALGGMAGAGGGAPSALPIGAAAPWIVIAWAAGVLVLSLRMACGLLWVRRLRSACGVDADGAWQARIDRLAARLGIARQVALRLMPGEGSPLTAGWLRPVVLLPLAVAARMPVDLVEALLAHELAHVRRHDYLVNVLQGVVEALLFYHPAVWWLSRRIRIERELVADDLAASALGDRRRLALALAELDRLVPDRSDAFPTHLATAAHGGQLMSRIQQLIRPQRRSAGALLALPLVGVALAGAAFYAHAQFDSHATASAVAEAVPAVAAAPAAEATPAIAASPAAEAAPAVAPEPAAAAAPAASAAPMPDDRSAYAFVRAGEEGISMSGNSDDIDDVQALRAKIGGDFLWFRRDGKAWIIRDADSLARARRAWESVQPAEKEMQALQAQMQPHSERMQALSKRMQALQVGDAFGTGEGREAREGIEDAAMEMQQLAAERMRLARRDRKADTDAERAEVERARAELDARQAAADAEMDKHRAAMEKLRARMEQQRAPMQAISEEMNATSEPMSRIGDQMSAVGKRIEREAKAADRQVRALIDQAYRDGRAEPAPSLR